MRMLGVDDTQICVCSFLGSKVRGHDELGWSLKKLRPEIQWWANAIKSSLYFRALIFWGKKVKF
jgi:hypothetical protein